MKLHCNTCGIFVAEIVEGSKIRKGATMICYKCNCAKPTPKESQKGTDVPEFLKSIFGKTY